jgi:hypothetical protein
MHVRWPDEVLYALAQYLYSLQPPPNPNLRGDLAAAGEKVFLQEGCAGCHAPPLYTNNRLTLAKGFHPPADHPLRSDIMPVSVGTDPSLALKTRKGTGLYKVPSLRGYGIGVCTATKELSPALRTGSIRHASGQIMCRRDSKVLESIDALFRHEFGLNLKFGDKKALIPFLRTL